MPPPAEPGTARWRAWMRSFHAAVVEVVAHRPRRAVVVRLFAELPHLVRAEVEEGEPAQELVPRRVHLVGHEAERPVLDVTAFEVRDVARLVHPVLLPGAGLDVVRVEALARAAAHTRP